MAIPCDTSEWSLEHKLPTCLTLRCTSLHRLFPPPSKCLRNPLRPRALSKRCLIAPQALFGFSSFQRFTNSADFCHQAKPAPSNVPVSYTGLKKAMSCWTLPNTASLIFKCFPPQSVRLWRLFSWFMRSSFRMIDKHIKYKLKQGYQDTLEQTNTTEFETHTCVTGVEIKGTGKAHAWYRQICRYMHKAICLRKCLFSLPRHKLFKFIPSVVSILNQWQRGNFNVLLHGSMLTACTDVLGESWQK